MSNQNKQRKFTKSLTFKVLCGLAVLVFLGLIYNLIVASDDAPMTEQEEEEVQKRNADADTIDIVGDYLWPNMKPSKEDMMTDEEKAAEANKAKLDRLASRYGQTSIEWLEDMTLPAELQSDRGSLSQFGRLFLGTILPESVHQVLYLDGDTVIKGPLDQLVETPFDGAIVMGVSDTFNKQYKQVLGIPADRPMFNSGVLWIDLDAWRQDKIEDKFIAIIQKFQGKVLQADLGILNAALYDRYKQVHPRFNAMTIFYDFDYRSMLAFKQPVNYYSEAILEEAKTQPVVRHFTTCFASKRPWVEGSQVAGIEDFKRYYQGAYIQQEEGLMTRLNRKLPQGLFAPILGFIQSQVRPRLYRYLKK